LPFTDVAAFLSTALAIYCTVPYIQAILKGKTKPHQLSWLVFVIVDGIVLFSQYLSGGRESILISLTFFIGGVIIFLLSLKWGTRDSSKWDWFLFLFALSAIVIWCWTRSNDVAIWLTLLIDLAASAMIILKVKSEPHSEDPYPWVLAAAAYVFSCLTLVGQPLGILYVRPAFGLISNAALAGFIYLSRKRMARSVEISPLEL
jgi:hypothetical protein